ncbi:MAG: Wzz/FepE/Etk N-terminal domain-containing protein, partial [Blautia wexlerae]
MWCVSFSSSHKKTSKLSNIILHQFEGLHKLWDTPKKIVWILLTTIVFAGAAGLITKFAMTPVYSSSAQLYVMSKSGISQLTDLTMGTQLTQDY